MATENKIYIPTNIQTEQMIFQGYGMKELLKTIVFVAIVSIVWVIMYLFIHSSMQLIFEELVTIAVGVSLFTKDKTNQSIVNYISYILKFSSSQRIYKYDNRIGEEENYIVEHHQKSLVSKENREQ